MEPDTLADQIAGLRFPAAVAVENAVSAPLACGNDVCSDQGPASDAASLCPVPTAETSMYRLKVVNLPRSLSEKDLVDLFSTCGTVFEARVVYDKASGLPVGYGYVSYGSKEEADQAISKLDGQVQLEGAPGRLSVYYAKKQHTLKESSPARNAKLYFCGTPAGCKREAILGMFSAFGRVRHLQVYVDSMGGLSSGTVTMFTTTEANAAMESLDGVILSEGTAPLKVTWAQLTTSSKAGAGRLQRPSAGITLAYGNVPGTVTPSELLSVFEGFGPVLQVVPFAQRRDGPRNCRGCGLVVMGSEQDAAAAIQALHGVSQWPGAERAMTVQPYSTGDRSMMPLQPGYGVPLHPSNPPAYSNPSNPPAYSNSMGQIAVQYPSLVLSSQGMPASQQPMMMQSNDLSGPKELFLSNLPLVYQEDEVLQLLQPYGSILQLQLLRNAQNGASVGQARVWFANQQQADAARQGLNGLLLLTGGPEQPLPLMVVPAANVAVGPQPRMVMAPRAQPGLVYQQGAVGSTVQQQHHQVLVPAGAYQGMQVAAGYAGEVGVGLVGQGMVQKVGWDGRLMPASQADGLGQGSLPASGGGYLPHQQVIQEQGLLAGPPGNAARVVLAAPSGVQVPQNGSGFY